MDKQDHMAWHNSWKSCTGCAIAGIGFPVVFVPRILLGLQLAEAHPLQLFQVYCGTCDTAH